MNRIDKHICKIKRIKFFDTFTYQCGCGKYFRKEEYDFQEEQRLKKYCSGSHTGELDE